jgi:TonB-dependent receptor
VNLERRGEEVVWATYFRADAQFFRQRLKLTGGVRAEQTNISGEGPLTDPTGNFQRDAAGNIVPRRDAAGTILRAPNGTPLPALIVPTTDALGVSKLTFLSRAARTSKEYLRLLPSLNASYNLRENLIVRGAFYQSVGRPPFSQYYNGITLPDTESIPSATNRISVNNPSIKAWQADTVRFVLEHYFERVGLVSVGVFRRDFKNFFGSTVLRATPELLQQLELDPAIYGAYDIATNYNLPTTVRVQGLDFNYKQALTFLPPWARGMQIFANVSVQRATGEAANANFQGYVPQTYNWGVSLARERYNLRANWNYRGRQRFAAVTGAGIEGGVYNWATKRLYLDLSGEIRLTRHFALVANLRNVNNATEDMKVFGPHTPDYATFRQREDFASLWTLGARATF